MSITPSFTSDVHSGGGGGGGDVGGVGGGVGGGGSGGVGGGGDVGCGCVDVGVSGVVGRGCGGGNGRSSSSARRKPYVTSTGEARGRKLSEGKSEGEGWGRAEIFKRKRWEEVQKSRGKHKQKSERDGIALANRRKKQ